MAFFKFRKGGDESPAAPPQPESVEALRRRARHRLIGAAVLVLLGVVGFPLLFDTQPRPVAVDIPIEIPDRNKARPLPAPPAARVEAQGEVSPTQPTASSVAAAPAARPASASASAASPAGRASVTGPVTEAPKPEAPKPEVARATPEASAPVARAASAPAARAASVPAAATARAESPASAARPAAANEGARAQALLEGQSVPAEKVEKAGAESAGRFVVQVGAFSDVAKARETRLKVEKAGLKTYTHVAETKDGRRIRVRVGPFATRAEADKAAGRIKELELPAAILTL